MNCSAGGPAEYRRRRARHCIPSFATESPPETTTSHAAAVAHESTALSSVGRGQDPSQLNCRGPSPRVRFQQQPEVLPEMVDDAEYHSEFAPELVEKLIKAAPTDKLDVIIELTRSPASASGSRQDRVAAAKASFQEALDAVSTTIADAGGTVSETAWINRTVRGSVPAGNLNKVAADDRVAAIDVPRSIEADASGTTD